MASELSPYALLGLSVLIENSWFGHVDAVFRVGMVLFLLGFVSGLGWIVVGHPLGAIAAFVSRILVLIIGFEAAAIHENGCRHIGCYIDRASWWIFALEWVALLAVPVISALLLWRWGRSVEHDDFDNSATVDDVDRRVASDPSAKSA